MSYVAAGFALFGCSENKTPLKKGWRDTPWNLRPILPKVFGVVIPQDMVVLDWDVRRDDIENNQLQKLKRLLDLPTPIPTLIVRTLGGGLHLYFRKPEEIKVKHSIEGFNAIDVQAHGRYVIGAGSVINGKQYRIVRGSIDHIYGLG